MYWVNGLYPLTVDGVNIFQPPNPGAGIPNGTQVPSAWLNDVQGELLNILNAADIAPAVDTPTQVLTALQKMFPQFNGFAGGGSVNSATSGTGLSTSVSFTASRNCLIFVNGNCGNNEEIENVVLTPTNATTLYAASNGAGTTSGFSAAQFNAILSAEAGAAVTIEATMNTITGGDILNIGFTYLVVPTA